MCGHLGIRFFVVVFLRQRLLLGGSWLGVLVAAIGRYNRQVHFLGARRTTAAGFPRSVCAVHLRCGFKESYKRKCAGDAGFFGHYNRKCCVRGAHGALVSCIAQQYWTAPGLGREKRFLVAICWLRASYQAPSPLAIPCLAREHEQDKPTPPPQEASPHQLSSPNPPNCRSARSRARAIECGKQRTRAFFRLIVRRSEDGCVWR